MDSFNPTTKTQAALTSALQAATAAGNPQITPAHLLMALLTQNDGIAAPLLEAVGVEPATIRTETQRLLDRLPSASGAASTAAAGPPVAGRDHGRPEPGHRDGRRVRLDRAPARRPGRLGSISATRAKLLTGHGASPQALRDAFVKVRGSARVTSPDPEGSYQALEKYSTDLTRARKRQARSSGRAREPD